MTYTAFAKTLIETKDTATFSSLRAAKAWARQHVTEKVDVVIIDTDMPSRSVRLFKWEGRSYWDGTAPESWFRA